MKKVRTFAAKLAHATKGKTKIICPVCHSEIKTIQLIHSRQSNGKWAPKREFAKICKCNEEEILA